jgi:hypothetical protein
MIDPLKEHEKLLAELEQQTRNREDAPKREKAMQLAKRPVDISRYRNERNLMLYPFCSTSKRKRLKTIFYQSGDGRRWLEVTANYEYGMAKIWDFDILRFALSKAGEIARQVGHFPSMVEFSAYECLKAIGRNPESGKNIEWLAAALDRLISTIYKGNIFREDEGITAGFTLVRYEYVSNEKGIDRIRLAFDERVLDSIRLFNGLLSFDPAVLHEEAGIKKRLLELVAVSKGKETSWTVGLERLRAMCAHEGAVKELKRLLKEYALPWKITFSPAVGGGENVTFSDLPDTAP